MRARVWVRKLVCVRVVGGREGGGEGDGEGETNARVVCIYSTQMSGIRRSSFSDFPGERKGGGDEREEDDWGKGGGCSGAAPCAQLTLT